MSETIRLDALTELNGFYVREYNAEKNLVMAIKEKRKLKLYLLKSGFVLFKTSEGVIGAMPSNELEYSLYEGYKTFPFEGKSQTLQRIQEALSDGVPINFLVYSNFIIEANREKILKNNF